ncbi:MAG: PEP-CTERM sorting domain-containing protein [Armatimonadetes bacterium]|nr:PEP-CTERM sorting domain-containing protein [Armatimonadota bacterium]
MKRGMLLCAVGLLVVATAFTAQAAPVFTDGFEGANIGALDKNAPGGANSAPNGSGNPWFGPNPPNGQVVSTDSGVTPHSGDHMLRGAFVGGADIDQNWLNIAYRFNGGNVFTGNLTLDWWFYDVGGAGDGNFKDYVALGYYNTAPSGTDYPGSGSLNAGASKIQRLSLGAQSTGDTSKYQARVVGSSDGYGGPNGWFNTSTSRSVGWHQARIVVGPALGDGTNDVWFYIDDMVNPTLTHNSVLNYGYNVIEVNSKFGSQTGYFDDFSLTLVPEPGSLLALGAGLVSLAGVVRRKRV